MVLPRPSDDEDGWDGSSTHQPGPGNEESPTDLEKFFMFFVGFRAVIVLYKLLFSQK
jgi:hypothetical protein